MKINKKLKRKYSPWIYLMISVTFSIIAIRVLDFHEYQNAHPVAKAGYIALGMLIIACVVSQMVRIALPYIKKWKYRRSPLAALDKMNPYEFENYAAWLLSGMGYKKCNVTVKSNDYGADVICRHNGKKVVVQVKRYRGKVGIAAVQQVVAAKAYYKAEEAVIFTNSYLTPSAVNLAKANNVKIIDREKLVNYRLTKKKVKEAEVSE